MLGLQARVIQNVKALRVVSEVFRGIWKVYSEFVGCSKGGSRVAEGGDLKAFQDV